MAAPAAAAARRRRRRQYGGGRGVGAAGRRGRRGSGSESASASGNEQHAEAEAGAQAEAAADDADANADADEAAGAGADEEAVDDDAYFIAGAEQYRSHFAGGSTGNAASEHSGAASAAPAAAASTSAAAAGAAAGASTAVDYDSDGNYAAANQKRADDVVYDEVFYERRPSPAVGALLAAASRYPNEPPTIGARDTGVAYDSATASATHGGTQLSGSAEQNGRVSDEEEDEDSDDEDDEDEDDDDDDDSSGSSERASGSGGFEDLSRTTEFERLLRQQSQGGGLQGASAAALPQSAALAASQRPTPYWRWSFPDAASAREADRSRGSGGGGGNENGTGTAADDGAAAAPDAASAIRPAAQLASAAAPPRQSVDGGYTRMPAMPFQLRAPQRSDSQQTKAVFVSSTQREIYRLVAAAHERIYEQVEIIVRYEMERMW